ncbi:MAG: DUF3313 family protein [Lysobacterales bacterium]
MKFGALLKTLLIASLATAAGPCVANGDPPEFTVDGLQLIEDSNLALVYAEPGVDLSQYSKIYLDTPYVAFKKNWQSIQNRYGAGRVTTEDMEKIKTELSALFMDVFSKTLVDGGYELTTGPGEDVLLVRPAIINLDIVAPDINNPGIVHSYSESAGEMTLYMELYDSVSGELLAKALDRKRDRKTGYFEWQNRVTNRAAANRILKVWADVLKEGLDDARFAASP